MIYFLMLLQQFICCPFKNYSDNALPQNNLFQMTQYEVQEENKLFSYSFNFWIQLAAFFKPNAIELIEESFNQNKQENGEIIFRLYEGTQLILCLYTVEEQLDNEDLFIIKSQFKYDPPSIIYTMHKFSSRLFPQETFWIMILITAFPNNAQLLIEISEWDDDWKVQILNNIELQKNLTIVLGGHCYLKSELNLNIFKGRITKLNIISPSFWNEKYFQDLNIFCRVPEKFIESFGQYSYNKGYCSYECETCLEGMPDYCTSCDSSLNRVLIGGSVCSCSPESQQLGIGTGLSSISNCIPINILLPVVSFIEVPIFGQSCQFSYFSIKRNNEIICVLCPYYSENIVCVECLRYSDNWYLKPVCKSDFIYVHLENDGIYQYRGRLNKNFEAYLIDDFNQLNYLDGVEDYCDEEYLEDTCFLYAQNHLGKNHYAKCKTGFLQKNGLCVFQKENSNLELVECLSGQYYLEGNCLACPIGCSQCNYNKDQLTAECNSCSINFILIQNQCIKCGQYCEKCIQFNNESIGKPYLKCVKCIDDSKYFFSFDGISCLENVIQNCQYAFQVYDSDLIISTLDYDFTPQFNSQKIETYCARCDENYVFIRLTKKCFQPKFINCQYGIADEVKIDELGEEILVNLICLFAQNNQLITKEYEDCSFIIEHCFKCLRNLQNINQCILCEKGYYKSRINGKCFKCLLDDCEQCVQQDIYQDDGWKENIRPFYQFFISKSYSNFNLKLFSNNNLLSNFKVICLMCAEDEHISLINGKCQQFCLGGCVKCQVINRKLTCNSCWPNSYKDNSIQLFNRCIVCQLDCKVCFVRTLQDISSYNPYYKLDNFGLDYHSNYQCFKYNNVNNNFYDSQIGQHVECKTHKNGCEKQNLFETSFNCDQLNNELFEHIFQEKINQNHIKTIIFKFTSTKPMICKIRKNLIFEQQYSNILFLAKNVELIFNFTHTIIWELESTITFVNFQTIQIYGLQIKIVNNGKNKIIMFKSLTFSQISFTNFSIFSHQNFSNSFQIEIFDSNNISLNNCALNEFRLSEQNGVFIFHKIAVPKLIRIIEFDITNCKLQSSNIFDFQLNSNMDYVEMKVNIIRTVFFISGLFSEDFNITAKTLFIDGLNISDTEISQTSGFIKGEKFLRFLISSINLYNSTLQNTNFLHLNSIGILSNILVLNNKFFDVSNFILVKRNTISHNFHQLYNITFQFNVYSINTKFIALKNQDSLLSNITIEQIKLLSNKLNKELNTTVFLSLNQSLVYIESQNVYLNDIYLERTHGLIAITIANSKQLQIMNSVITQSNDQQYFGIHDLNCLSQYIKGKKFPISIHIYSAQLVNIIKMDIVQMYSLNHPIIFYQSEQKIILNQREEFYFNQIKVTQNLIVQTEIEVEIAIFKFISVQQTYLEIKDSIFSSNLLKFYSSIQITNSALLFSFDMKYSKVIIQSSSFNSNLVLNGNNSIIYIKSQSVSIVNCNFSYNNYFQYEILKPFLFWANNEKIYLEDLENTFSIQSISGNGQFQADEIKIISSVFSNSQGTKGAGVYLQYYQSGFITLKSIVLESQMLNLNTMSDQGSAFYISSSEESELTLKVENISASSLFSNQQGGLIYIYAQSSTMYVQLNNLKLQNVYATTGQLIYFSPIKQKQKIQFFELKNITVQNSLSGLNQFLSYFNQKNQKTNFSLNEFSLSRNIIHLENIQHLISKSILFNSLILESPFYLFSVEKIILSEITISDSILNSQGIYIYPDQYLPGQFIIESSNFFNLTFSSQIIIINQSNIITYKQQNLSLACYPQTLPPESITYKNKILLSVFDFFSQGSHSNINETQRGIINFNELNSIHQILLDNNYIQNVDCSKCTAGLIFLNFQKDFNANKRQQISNLIITNNSCGPNGCLKIQVQYQKNYSVTQTANTNILQTIDFFISNYFCQQNQAINGTCLVIENTNILIQNSDFQQNQAQQAGGAVYIQQSSLKEQAIFQATIIKNNQAQIGGGIYSNSQINLYFQKLDSIISQNNAKLYADDVVVQPSKLKIEFNQEQNNLFEIVTITENDNYKLELFKLKKITNMHGINTNFYLLPSGVQISQYKYFNWKNHTYIPMNFKFRIKALTDTGVEIQDLLNSYCMIKSAVYNQQNQENINFTNNYTNYHTVNFNINTLDYNLDDLIIYYRSMEEYSLLLEFWCNSIFVPKYSKKYPYNLIQQHNSYHLRIQIQTFSCQLGEILNETYSFCQLCDAQKGFFSVDINSNKCQLRDEVSTKEVRPAQLSLRTNFWRPYFDSSQPSECTNGKENCLGGWIEGDNSCFQGHIGALCEQCDINNVRGNGHYFQSSLYSCSSCDQKREQELYALLGLLWSLITITVSALGSVQSSSDHLQSLKLKTIGFRIILKHKPQSILIKIITNYFQILSILASFQIQYPYKAEIFIYSTTQSILPLSLYCYFNGLSDIETIYQIQILYLVLPFLYLNFFLAFYGIGFLIKKIRFNKSVIKTVGLYLFIYFQPNIIRNLLSTISYRQISGYYWISANVSYRYDRRNHFYWMYQFCIPTIFLFGLLLPLLVGYKLFQNRKRLDDQKFASNWGYLYNDYNRRAYFWEVFKIILKVGLMSFIIFYQDQLILKCIFIIFLLTAYSRMNLQFNPFNFVIFNFLDYRSTKIAIISFTLLIGIFQSQISQIYLVDKLFLVLLIIINIHFIGLLLIKLVIVLQLQKFLLDKFKPINESIQKRFPKLIKCFNKENNNQRKNTKIQDYYKKLKYYLRKTAVANIKRRKENLKQITEHKDKRKV